MNKDGTLIKVWTRHEVRNTSNTIAILDFTSRVLAYFEDLFDVAYPLSKLDVVILPTKDTVALATPGLIICHSEDVFFQDSKKIGNIRGSAGEKILAHEVSHQWLGNLAQLNAWNELWMFEGLASYLDDKAVYLVSSASSPSDGDWRHQPFRERKDAFKNDEDVFSLPLHPPFVKLSQITDSLDSFYQKGSAVLLMAASFLDHAFITGVSSFLTNHQYKPASESALWRHLTEAAHEAGTLPTNLTVKTIMDTWTLQIGYPVIKVERSQDGTSATVSQERFLLVKDDNSDDIHDYKWWVPLTYTGQHQPDFSHTQPKVWMKDSEAHLTLTSLPPKDQWVIFNLQQTGYYRVNYDLNNWNLLIQQLLTQHTAIATVNRAQIVDDALSLARGERLSYDVALETSSYLRGVSDPLVMETLLSHCEYLDAQLSSTAAYGGFRKYLASLFDPLYNKLGTPSQNHSLNFPHSANLLKWACRMGHTRCLRQAKRLFREWMDKPEAESPVAKELQETMYCSAIAQGGEREWDFAWQQYFVSQDQGHKDALVKALACTTRDWRKIMYLDMAFTAGVKLRPHDTFQIFTSVASQPGGKRLIWNLITRRWSAVMSMFGYREDVAKTFLKTSTATFNHPYQLAELEAFIWLQLQQGKQYMKQAAESTVSNVISNIRWREQNYDTISTWLHSHGFPTKLMVL